MNDHQHSEEVQQQPKPRRRPSEQRQIERLNQKLNEKASIIRGLEDNVVFFEALEDDYKDEITGLRAAMDQIVVENRLLRKRLDLPETGAIELDDDEALELPPEMVTETDDDLPPDVRDTPSDDVVGTAEDMEHHHA